MNKATSTTALAEKFIHNANDQPDTETERKFREQLAVNDRKALAEEIQQLVYYQNKCFLSLLKLLATSSTKEKSTEAAILLFGAKGVTNQVIDEMFNAGMSLAELSDFQIHKLSYKSLFLIPSIDSLKMLQRDNLMKLEREGFKPEERLTILFKALHAPKKV